MSPRARSMGSTDDPMPTGLVAFLFTDLEGSTSAWEHRPDEMVGALRLHDDLCAEAFADHRGRVFSTGGDGYGVAFHSAVDALAAAVQLQRSLDEATFPGGVPMRVRIGVHIGTAVEERQGDYFGADVNRAARIMGLGHGGQVLVTEQAATTLSSLPDDVSLRSLGPVRLRGVDVAFEVHQADIAGLPTEFPPIKGASGSVRVPRYDTSFVGRQADAEAVVALLDEHRLVTMLAPGGTGKTRLATELSLGLVSEFADGVFFAELADTGPGGVGRLVAEEVIGAEPLARAGDDHDPVAALTSYLATKRALVVFDNCEHVLDDAAEVAGRLLDACPDVKVLATSREQLGVGGERRYPLLSLVVSISGTELPPAVELFVERGRAVIPDFDPTGDDLDAVIALCRRLDGLPLAIELAASRLRTLPVAQLADRLDDAIGLLRERRSQRPDRHRSLEAAIQWSYDLLDDDDERDLFERLAVFAGGFDLAAAEAMGTSVGLGPDTLDIVESLVDKSLVTARPTDQGSRYLLPEPIRQFAEARLAAAEVTEEAMSVHREHFRSRVELGVPDIDGPPGRAAIAALDADHDNLRAVVDRLRPTDPLAALRMVRDMGTYWEESGRLAEGADLIVGLLPEINEPEDLVRGHGLAMAYGALVGRQADAERSANEVAPFVPLLPPAAAAGLRFAMGFVDAAAGRWDSCVDHWAGAADAAEERVPMLSRQARLSVGYIHGVNGEPELANAHLDRAAAVVGGEQEWFAVQHRGFEQLVATLAGDEVHPGLSGSLDDVAALQLRFRTLLMAGGTALAALGHDDHDLGQRAWRLGLETAREMGHVWASWVVAEFAAWTAATRGDRERAAWMWGGLEEAAAVNGWGRWRLVDQWRIHHIDRAREHDPGAFDTARERGRSASLLDVVEAGLSLPTPAEVDDSHRRRTAERLTRGRVRKAVGGTARSRI